MIDYYGDKWETQLERFNLRDQRMIASDEKATKGLLEISNLCSFSSYK